MRWNEFYEEEQRLKKPAYDGGTWAAEIDSLLSELEERSGFSYDPGSDPLYRQYRQQYRREGSRAVEDTLAEAASHAGGMNSYAVTAAQQAGDVYSARLLDKLPELAALAYEMYQAEYDRDLDRLDRLQEQEKEEYDRYRDALAEWYDRQDEAYQRYRDAVKDGAASAAGGTDTAAEDGAHTDYYQQALDAARAGDRAGAEAALAKRAAKMADPSYTGTGGGTSMAEAYARIEELLTAASSDTDGRTYDNGSLTREQVAELQNYYEVEADGLWGRQSAAAAGGQTAEQAWEEYRKRQPR